MDASSWISLAIGGTTLFLNVIAIAVGYGALTGAVTAMNNRVTALEREMGTLNELKVAVGKIETKQDALVDHLHELNASIRWMREPASDYAAPPKPRRRTRPTEDG
jgi:peptidoglycan hydrolase CwlO-like protein